MSFEDHLWGMFLETTVELFVLLRIVVEIVQTHIADITRQYISRPFLTTNICGPPPLPITQQALVEQGLLTVEVSRSHSDTPHSAGVLWTSDQPDTETST